MLHKLRDRWGTLPRWQKVTTGVAATFCAGAVAFTATLPSGGDNTTKESHSPSTHTDTAGYGKALAVKVDNVKPARPSTGVQHAKVVYVEQVEGGLTRIMAVFGSDDLPGKIGPVRSARETDLDVLAQYGKVAFAYSGATTPLLPYIGKANVYNLSHEKASGPYYRSGPHWAPHNLYINPKSLMEKASGASELRVSADNSVPAGGVPDLSVGVSYPAASYGFQWNGKNYTVAMDGTTAQTYDSGTQHANTVIVQHVSVSNAVHGSYKSPYSHTVGSGKAEVYRDGKRYDTKWNRATLSDRTSYEVNGKNLDFDTGQTWVLLVR